MSNSQFPLYGKLKLEKLGMFSRAYGITGTAQEVWDKLVQNERKMENLRKFFLDNPNSYNDYQLDKGID